MGFEVPAALGAQVADPKATVWSNCGDGGFQMTFQELATIVDEKLPIKFAIMNNGFLGMVRQWQELFYQENLVDVNMSQPDFLKIAEPYGIQGIEVTKKDQVVDAIREAITDKTRMILINSPCNPTGAVFTPEELQEIVDIAVEHDLWIVSDEIYARLVWMEYPHVSPYALPGGSERTLIVNGWSKSWAMTGMRLGFLTGPSDAMKAAIKSQANSASHVPTFLMRAATVALGCDDSVEMFNGEYLKRRQIMLEGLSEISGLRVIEPEGAFYVFVDVTGTGMSDIEFADGALEAGVQLIPASLISGGEGFVRISYATDEEAIHEGLRRLKGWLVD